MICIGSDVQFQVFCGGLDRPELSDSELYATNKVRVNNRKGLVAIIEDVLGKYPRDEWLRRFDGLHFPFGPVRSVQEAFDDPQAQFREMTVQAEHPKCGTIRMAGPPVKYSRTPLAVRRPPPILGEHTTEVLRDVLQLTEEQIKYYHVVDAVETSKTL